MVHKMYKPYSRPLVRIVHGLQASWDPVIATMYDEGFRDVVVWSPCNQFIAALKPEVVEIRDAITLNLLSTFKCHRNFQTLFLSFSIDSRYLTQFSRTSMVTWDLQTGGSVAAKFPEELSVKDRGFLPAYSTDGKMLVGDYHLVDSEDTFITTHDFSTTRTHFHRVLGGHMFSLIWAHGDLLRFVTMKPGYITVWQAEPTFTHPPEVVESLSAPDELINKETSVKYLFLPAVARLAIALDDTLLVWDARNSKHLLKISRFSPLRMSFSSDGHFFSCVLLRGFDQGIHIWNESPAGYVLHRKLTIDGSIISPRPLLSPSGGSIIVSGRSTIHLLYTEDPFLSSRPTLDMSQCTFTLSFSPNDTLAAFVNYPENVLRILDLRSKNNPPLEIYTGMGVKCLGVAGDTVVAVNHERIVTWKLATRNTRANIHDSVRITTLDPSPYHPTSRSYFVSVSSDLSRIITLAFGSKDNLLAIYNMSTGRRLADSTLAQGALKPLSTPHARFKVTDIDSHVGVKTAWPTQDGRQVWGASDSNSPMGGWEAIEDGESGTTRLHPLGMTACRPGALPWQSSRGYEVTHDGWILSPTQRRLLWLPHRWRSAERDRKWGGPFLGLFHRGLPDVVILEFLD